MYLILFSNLKQIYSRNSSPGLASLIKLQHTMPCRKQSFIHHSLYLVNFQSLRDFLSEECPQQILLTGPAGVSSRAHTPRLTTHCTGCLLDTSPRLPHMKLLFLYRHSTQVITHSCKNYCSYSASICQDRNHLSINSTCS